MINNTAVRTKLLLEVELIMCAVPVLLCHLYLPAGPKVAPSAAVSVPTEALGFGAWVKRFWTAVSNRTLFLIAVITGIEAGVISTWGGIMQVT